MIYAARRSGELRISFDHLEFDLKYASVFAIRPHRNASAAAGIEPATSISAAECQSHWEIAAVPPSFSCVASSGIICWTISEQTWGKQRSALLPLCFRQNFRAHSVTSCSIFSHSWCACGPSLNSTQSLANCTKWKRQSRFIVKETRKASPVSKCWQATHYCGNGMGVKWGEKNVDEGEMVLLMDVNSESYSSSQVETTPVKKKEKKIDSL